MRTSVDGSEFHVRSSRSSSFDDSHMSISSTSPRSRTPSRASTLSHGVGDNAAHVPAVVAVGAIGLGDFTRLASPPSEASPPFPRRRYACCLVQVLPLWRARRITRAWGVSSCRSNTPSSLFVTAGVLPEHLSSRSSSFSRTLVDSPSRDLERLGCESDPEPFHSDPAPHVTPPIAAAAPSSTAAVTDTVAQ